MPLKTNSQMPSILLPICSFSKHLLTLFFLMSSFTLAIQAAGIKGKIYDAQTNEPLIGASVYLQGTVRGAASNVDGDYLLENVPAGHYTMVVSYVGYLPYKKEIDVKENQTLKLDVGMKENIQHMNAITVFGKLDKETEISSRLTEKNADNEKNVISAKTMISSPDISAGSVLQRLSGVTLQKTAGSDEAYSIIRGMEPRYNNTLINGVKIPSPDDKTRFISLNIIPSDLLQSISVSKTLLPDMEGDAIGGTVNLIAKDAPDQHLLRVKASIGYTQTLADRPYTSFNQSIIQQQSPNQIHGTDYSAKPGDFTRANLDFQSQKALPNGSLGVTYGRRFFKGKLGMLIGDQFQNKYDGTHSEFNTIAPLPNANNQFRKLDVTNRSISSQQLNNGLNAHFDYEFNPNNKLNLDNVFIYSYFAQSRTSIDTALVGSDRFGPGTGYITPSYRSLTKKQRIENLKLSGKHLLSDRLLLNWSGVMAIAGKSEPDRAEIVTDFHARQDGTQTAAFFDSGTHLWQHNNDRDYTGKADLTYRTILSGRDLELKAGGLYRKKNRYNRQDQYILNPTIDPQTGQKQQYTTIYAANYIVYNPRGTAQYDNSNYNASENIGAGYVQAKLSVNKLQLVGGVRVENTNEGFHTKPYRNGQPTDAAIKYTDVLPSLHMRYNLNPRQALRLSYYKSISRPGYYELVPYTQPGLFYDEKGNPYLQHTKADNFDLRYELFPNPKDQLFAGVFYKAIVNPIEYALVTSQLGRSGQIVYTPQNFGTAHNYGFELQFTKHVGDFGFTGNYTYTHSTISSPKIFNDSANNTSKTVLEQRPLQGQSNHVANISMMYRNNPLGFFGQLDVQFVGKTLSKVTNYYHADYYQKPQLSLAASLEKSIGSHITLFSKLDNLLNTPSVININNSFTVVRNTYRASAIIGIRFSN